MTVMDTNTVTCGFCAQAFEESRGQLACRLCPLTEACRFLRCPHCGYENPVAPNWLKRLQRWRNTGEPR